MNEVPEMYEKAENFVAKLKLKFLEEQKSEASLEKYFTIKVKQAGGWAIKLNPLGTTGLPDRIVFYQSGVWLIELKSLKGIVKKHQKAVHKRFESLGHRVQIIRTKEQVLNFVKEMIDCDLK